MSWEHDPNVDWDSRSAIKSAGRKQVGPDYRLSVTTDGGEPNTLHATTFDWLERRPQNSSNELHKKHLSRIDFQRTMLHEIINRPP